MIRWRELVKQLGDAAERGEQAAHIRFDEGSAEGELVVTGLLLTTDHLTNKGMRRAMWDHRRDRAFQRGHGALWFVQGQPHSYFGVGAIVSERVRERYERRFT